MPAHTMESTDEAAISHYLESNPGHDDADCAVRLGTVNNIRWIRCLTHKSEWVAAGER